MSPLQKNNTVLACELEHMYLAYMIDLRTIAVFTRDDDQEYPLEHVTARMGQAGIRVLKCGEAHEVGDVDMVLALGGDGTVLRALSRYPGIPICAVNYGNVGFLTQSERGNLDGLLERLITSDYFIEERLSLEVSFRGRAMRSINELVVKGAHQMVEIEIRLNEQLVHTPRGDGVIIGTPTGSTAYLLSTGAPLIVPDVDCMAVKPLNEYRISSRMVIVPGDTHIRLTVKPGAGSNVSMSIDGGAVEEVEEGESIEVVRSEVPARLVCFQDDYFFRNLKERLGW